MDPAGAGSPTGRCSCSEWSTGRGKVSPGVVRRMVPSGPRQVRTLLCLGVSDCELPYGYGRKEVLLCQPGLVLAKIN